MRKVGNCRSVYIFRASHLLKMPYLFGMRDHSIEKAMSTNEEFSFYTMIYDVMVLYKDQANMDETERKQRIQVRSSFQYFTENM